MIFEALDFKNFNETDLWKEILNINTWPKIRLPRNISCHVIATAQGILNNKVFSGKFTARMNFLNSPIEINMTGTFEIYLA